MLNIKKLLLIITTIISSFLVVSFSHHTKATAQTQTEAQTLAQTNKTQPQTINLLETKQQNQISKNLLTQNNLPPLPKPDLLPGPNDPNNQNSAQDVLNYTTNRLLPAASARFVTIIAFLSILSLIYAGTKYYTAMGDEGQADEAKKIIIYSLLGLVISLMSLAIVSIIAAFTRFFQ